MHRLFLTICLLLSCCTSPTAAASPEGKLSRDFSTISPTALEISLGLGEPVIKQISITIYPTLIRPIFIDVVASNPNVFLTNHSGVDINSGDGDTSTFDIEITGAGIPQHFDLYFVDSETDDLLGALPVTLVIKVPYIEPLKGLAVLPEGIVFQVASSGCTSKADFQVDVLESDPLQLRLIRLQEDPCDASLPFGTVIRFSYQELGIVGGSEFRVINPLATVFLPR